MSTSDKTGDQLANTIRKAKTGPGTSPTDATPSKAAAPAKKAPAKKASARKAPAKKAPTAKKTQTKPSSENTTAARFQHGRRVWPD